MSIKSISWDKDMDRLLGKTMNKSARIKHLLYLGYLYEKLMDNENKEKMGQINTKKMEEGGLFQILAGFPPKYKVLVRGNYA